MTNTSDSIFQLPGMGGAPNEAEPANVAKLRMAGRMASDAPADKLGVWDFIIAVVLGLVAAGAYTFWAYPGIHPEAWEDAAVAAGVRPAANVIPGLWQLLTHGVYKLAGLSFGNLFVHLAGRVAVGFAVSLGYLLFREVLGLAVRLRLQHAAHRYMVARFAAAMGALCLAFANPVWNLAQTFTPSTLLFTMTVWGLYRFFRFLMRGSLPSAYFAMFLFGLLAAETPLGFVLLAVSWGMYLLAIRDILPFDMPLLDPYVQELSKWHMTFLFVFAVLTGIALDWGGFIWLDGLEANGMSFGDLPLFYANSYAGSILKSASIAGWACGAVVALMPLAVAATLLPRATDEEQFLPYHIGALFLLLGIVAYTQTAGLPALWFWQWIDAPQMVPSRYLLGIFSVMSAGTVVFALAVLGVDGFCRDHRRLVAQFFSELRTPNDDDDPEGDLDPFGNSRTEFEFAEPDGTNDESAPEPPAHPGLARAIGKIFFAALPLALIAGLVYGAPQTKNRELLQIVQDGVDETVNELTASDYLFTDGTSDAMVELTAATRGRPVVCENLFSGQSARDKFLRTRTLTENEDLLAAGLGASALARLWVRDKPEALAKTAIQMCFELWKRDGKALPPASGLLAQPLDTDSVERERGVQAAYGLGDRILRFYEERGAPSRDSGPVAKRLFHTLQWRLARLSRIRAEMYDRRDLNSRAMEEVERSDKLDRANEVLRHLREAMDRMEQHAMRQMTPREGLQLALVRADFVLARFYAEPILNADPQDPDANFAVGMSYFKDGSYARAKEYLSRCLLRRPNEPAVYNNLAIAQLKTGRLQDALRNAKRALELVPESSEIRETVQEIEDAIENARDSEAQLKEAQGAHGK